MSLKPLLNFSGKQLPDRVIFSHWNGRVSARNQIYRFDHEGRLYDMTNDPGQKTDLSAARPDISQWFSKQVDAWITETFIGMRNIPALFPVGHPDFKYTQLPARDGIPHGNIERSNRFPNSSFFTSWTSLSDSITWEVEVIEDGHFSVDFYYTCPEEAVGSVIELSMGKQRLTTQILIPHNPPLTGAEYDRITRIESYEKDFRMHNAGTIFLEKGTGQLVLKAVDIPGSEIMDFRTMILTRLH
jgi:hypothetical protein